MKVWIKRTAIGLTAAATLLGAAAAFAYRGDHGGYFGWRAVSAEEIAPMQARVMDRAGRMLDLDAAQKAKLAVLAERVREGRNSMVATSSKPRDELKAAMAGATFDRARVNTLVQSQLSMAMAQSPGVVNAAADFYDSLRPDQQAKLRDTMERGRNASREHGRWGQSRD